MTLHLVRHAQSNWNVLTACEHVGAHPEIVDVDSRLSGLGKQQAEAQEWDALQPPPELVLVSPLSRALETALALVGDVDVEVRVTALATEWCENSCDCGRPGAELALEYPRVRGLAALGAAQWWPLSLADIRAGEREAEASVDWRCAQLLDELRGLPHRSVAVVAHCMVLDKLERLVRGSTGASAGYLANVEVRTLHVPPAAASPRVTDS